MGFLNICLSIYGRNESICEILRESAADLFEIRLDLSPHDLDLAAIRAATKKEIIFTAHSAPHLLKNAAPFANYLDVGPELISGSNYIVSIHADDADADQLWEKYSGNHLTKIVLKTEDYSSILKLIRLNEKHHPKAICFAMGEVGSFSRILSGIAGAPWIYSSLPGKPTAKGQIAIDDLINLYRIKRFSSVPSIFGIIGDPVSHSRSPAFHNEHFASENLNWIYLPFRCKDAASFLKCAPQFGVRGLSVTHPHKESVISFLKHSSDEVRMLRSCNTMFFDGENWHGINTDVAGIEEVFKREAIRLQNVHVTILGAGGAARAAAFAAKRQGAQLRFLNRTVSKAEALAAEFGGTFGSLLEFRREPCDLLIQATAFGMNSGEIPIDPAKLQSNTIVMDAIYEPDETDLLRHAKKIGCRTINGKIWFEAQAEKQFEWWMKIMQISDKLNRD